MIKKINLLSGLLVLSLVFVLNCGIGSSSDNSNDNSSDNDNDNTGDNDNTDTDADIGTFTNGTETLTADTSESGDTRTTVITDADGTEILTMTLDVNGISLAFTGYDGTTDVSFTDVLSALPTEYSANLLAAYVAGQLRTEGTMSLSSYEPDRSACSDRDSAGCDFFPDTACTLGCCADHDVCYDLNGCSASSWLPLIGSAACKNCNAVVAGCIELSCLGVIDTFTEDNCYDHRCNQHYECDDGSCDCTSPCTGSVTACTTSSETECCGNGSCDVNEDVDTCYSDCYTGDGTNTCCVETDDCPSELAASCPGDCCCCGYGEVCDQSGTDLCIASDRGGDSFEFGTKTLRW